jgi:two-component system CheB/CheR fusion protein
MAGHEGTGGDECLPDEGDEAFFIVGIGASAGGVAATRAIFENLPDDPGMAFIVVQHLDPNRESELAQILQNDTGMPVEQVTDRSEVVPNHVYVIPAGKSLTIEGRALRLAEPDQPHGQRAPIDRFFRSLAASQKGHAICIVLSGMGEDGASGLKEVKSRGGITMAQLASEAQYDSMPQSAIDTGMVDFVLPIHELTEKLAAIRQSRPKIAGPEGGELAEGDLSTLQQLFGLLRSETGHDFSGYKRPTMLRRIARRMQIHQLEDMADYLGFLQDQPDEVHELFRTLLINVTSFFRDPDAFEALKDDVIPKLFEQRTHQDEVRVWVPGCATGEEAYSIAILLAEEAAQHADAPGMQILATDPASEAISYAREGMYPTSIEENVSPERLRRFFSQEATGYRVHAKLREAVLFAEHDLLSDPPFSNIDLVSCRNVLIYLQRELQGDVLKLFHYALNPEGYLFLGTSESVDAMPRLFAAFDREHRLFQVQQTSQRPSPFPMLRTEQGDPGRAQEEGLPADRDGPPEPEGFGALHRQALAELAPPSVLIGEDYTILHVGEGAEPYLRFPSGDPTQNLMDVVRDELQADLRTAIFRAFRRGERCEVRVRVEGEGEPRAVELVARPLERSSGEDGVLQVLFKERELGEDPMLASSSTEQDEMIQHLEENLNQTREELSATIEEYETANEELKASNEELHVMNEELKSTNQELEASKEELQVVNEDLAEANSDLRNLMNSIEFGVLILDRELCLTRYTPRVERLFNVIPSDRGRPLAHITSKIDYVPEASLVEDARHVLDELETVEREVNSEDDRWYLVRLLPYRTLEDKIDGVVITFLDITERRRYQEALATRERQQSAVAGLSRHALQEDDVEHLMNRMVREVAHTLDVELCKILAYRPDHQDLLLEAGVGWKDGLVGEATVDAGRDSQAGYTLISDGPVVVEDLDAEKRFDGPPLLAEHDVVSGVSVIIPGTDRPYGVMGVHTREQRSFSEQDAAFLGAVAYALGPAIERRKMEEALRRSEERYRLIVENMKEYAIFTLDTEGHVTSWNPGAEKVLGYEEEEILGEPVSILFLEEDRAAGVPEQEMETAKADSHASDDRWQRRKDGSQFWASGIMTALYDEEGALRGFVKILRDLTERKRLRDELEARAEERAEELFESRAREQAMFDALPDIILRLSEEGVVEEAHVPDPGKLVVPLEEKMGQSIFEVLPDQAVNPLKSAFDLVLETGDEADTEFVLPTQDGKEHTFEVRLTPAGDGVLMIKRDVTEQRQLEREILEITERERQRIAKELHDDLGQQLMGAQFLSRSLRRQLEGDESAHVEDAEEITDEINDAIDYVRTLSHGLATVDMSEGHGLDGALRRLVENVERAFDVQCIYESEGPDQEDQTTATHLYRIAQEAVNNAVRHGEADEVRIRRLADEKGLMLRIEDDGSGIPEEALEGEGGLGLRSMRYRANLIQCRLSIQRRSEAGGTVVSCTRSRS